MEINYWICGKYWEKNGSYNKDKKENYKWRNIVFKIKYRLDILILDCMVLVNLSIG